VAAGQVLAELNTTELRLQLAESEAAVRTKQREAEARRAEGKIAEQKIAEAERDENQARAGLYAQQISQSKITAPMSGVLIVGDLMDKRGAPIKKGDVMFEVARGEDGDPARIAVEAEMQVWERDIQELKQNGQSGRLSTSSFPSDAHQFTITRVVPQGEAKDGENHFRVYARLDETTPWMHPGLAGEVRIEVGPRRVIWIWTHRLTDWLKLKLWTFPY
jgi:multidrug resistance efflux pump